MEGYFYKGSVILGALHDMMHDPPRLVYTGLLLQGKRNGFGVSYYADGSPCYKGSWLYDLEQGYGKTFWKSTGLLQYEGNFSRGMKEGIGRMQETL